MVEITGDGTNELLEGLPGELNTLAGGGGDDTLIGGPGGTQDVLRGDEDSDRIIPNGGSDNVFGGSGTDTVVFNADRATSTINPVIDSGTGQISFYTVVYTDPVNGFGVTSMREVEFLEFNDGTFSIETVLNDPVAIDDVVTIAPGETVSIDVTANDTDPDRPDFSLLTGFFDTDPSKGTIELTDFTAPFVYTPDPGFVGIDTFTYELGDGEGGFDTGTVTVNVVAPNTTPVAVDDDSTTAFETSVLVDVLNNDTDADGDTLSIDGIAVPPNNGVAAIENGQIRYTPNDGFSGTDTFTYGIVDGMGGSDIATATVTVSGPLNTPPTAVDDAAVSDGSAITANVLANDSDVDGDTLNVVAVTTPANGAASVEGNQIRYTPDAGFSGTDVLTYTIDDGQGGSDTATLSVIVTSTPNQAPFAVDDVDIRPWSVGANYTFFPLTNDTDADGDALRITSFSSEAGPVEAVTDPNTGFTTGLRYDFSGGFNGVATINYTVGDDRGGESEARSILYIGWNTSKDTVDPLEIGLTGDDFGFGTSQPARASGEPGENALTFAGSSWTEDRLLESDAFGAEINGFSAMDLLDESFLPILAAAGNPDASLTFDLAVDGERQFFVDADQRATELSYAPDETWSFLYRVRDETGQSAVGVLSVEIGTDATPNLAPVAGADSVRTAPGRAVVLDVLSNDTDADSDLLTLETDLPTGPRHGTATVADGQITYVPDAGFTGTDSFVYAVEDGQGGLAVGAVEVAVGSDPDQPVAVADATSTDQFVPVEIPVLSNDNDPNGDPLSITEVTRPSRGVVAINEDGTLSYVPRRGFTGEDSFTYTLSDGQGGSAAAEVSVTVNDLPEDVVIARVVAYLYEAALGRFPDLGGVNFWINVVNGGGFTLTEMAGAFLGSQEFTDLFGAVDTLSDRQLIDQLYLNVLDRPGEAGGVAFWEGQLGLPTVSREDMLLSFAESAENQLGSPRIVTLVETAEDQWDFTG
ncbi:MAG: Ig-like domain-containing protein [Pseudomonadota bacterium]